MTWAVPLLDEIWLGVLVFCNVRDSAALSQTCQALKSIVNSDKSNDIYWRWQYGRVAYGDTQRLLQWQRRTQTKFGTTKIEDGTQSHENFKEALRMIARLNLSGIWTLNGEHLTGRPYRYSLEIRQMGKKIFCITAWPFVSVGVGRLTGTMFCLRQFCQDRFFAHDEQPEPDATKPPSEIALSLEDDADTTEIWGARWLLQFLHTSPETVLDEAHSDDFAWAWSNYCSGVCSTDGTVMRGTWIQVGLHASPNPTVLRALCRNPPLSPF